MARQMKDGEKAAKARRESLRWYYQMKADPEKFAEYKEKKRLYHQQHYQKNVGEFKTKAAERWEMNKERWKPRRRQYYKENAAEIIRKTTIARRKRLFGVDEARYAEMLANQGGGCAICGAAPNPDGRPATRTLCVDHDHVTGAVRSLLCHKCNKALGAFPTVELAEKAATYLKGHA